ncbi:MAG: response regulator [Candidatus Binatia bacterium]
MTKIRVLLADDHAVLRAGLRMLINAQADMRVVGEAGEGHDTVDKTAALLPDVVLMDLTMPGGGGMDALKRIRRERPQTRVLVLTMHDDPAYARASVAAGAAGLVIKDVDGEELLNAIRIAYQGRMYVSTVKREPGVDETEADAAWTSRAESLRQLSRREITVLEMVAQGHTNQEIATRLALSVKTVETYRARVMDKLALRNRAELVRFAIEQGLLGPKPDSDPHP